MATSEAKSRGNGKAKASPEMGMGRLFGESTRKSGLDADWNEVLPTVLHTIVWAVDYLGGAVTFSTTKNGQAYVIKVYLGKAYDPIYFDGDEEGRAAMEAWANEVMTAAAEHG